MDCPRERLKVRCYLAQNVALLHPFLSIFPLFIMQPSCFFVKYASSFTDCRCIFVGLSRGGSCRRRAFVEYQTGIQVKVVLERWTVVALVIVDVLLGRGEWVEQCRHASRCLHVCRECGYGE